MKFQEVRVWLGQLEWRTLEDLSILIPAFLK